MKLQAFDQPIPINAWGTPTPYGVSRSSSTVAAATALALQSHFDIASLRSQLGKKIIEISKAQAVSFCHCAAAGIMVSAAAALAGTDEGAARALPRPDETGVIAINAEHCVDYGHSITQAIRTAGARLCVLSGDRKQRLSQLENLSLCGALRAVVWVESLLVQFAPPLDRDDLLHFSRAKGVLLIVDAAAKDWKLNDENFVAEADLTIFSAQKYLAAPTCGLIVGRFKAISAFDINLANIGRPMKTTKEALLGLWAAIVERDWANMTVMTKRNLLRAKNFSSQLQRDSNAEISVECTAEHGPFPRIHINLKSAKAAEELVDRFLRLPRPIALGPSRKRQGIITVELTHVNGEEEQYLIHQLRQSTVNDAAAAGELPRRYPHL